MKWITNLLTNKNRIKELEAQNTELREEVQKKQAYINKTNAYWKKKMFQVRSQPQGSL